MFLSALTSLCTFFLSHITYLYVKLKATLLFVDTIYCCGSPVKIILYTVQMFNYKNQLCCWKLHCSSKRFQSYVELTCSVHTFYSGKLKDWTHLTGRQLQNSVRNVLPLMSIGDFLRMKEFIHSLDTFSFPFKIAIFLEQILCTGRQKRKMFPLEKNVRNNFMYQVYAYSINSNQMRGNSCS